MARKDVNTIGMSLKQREDEGRARMRIYEL